MKRANSKKLPKGLAEFEASLHDLEYASQLLPRLLDLPDAHDHMQIMLDKFNAEMVKVEEAEKKAADARDSARKVAERMWKECRSSYSIKTLQEATGYDDE